MNQIMILWDNKKQKAYIPQRDNKVVLLIPRDGKGEAQQLTATYFSQLIEEKQIEIVDETALFNKLSALRQQ